MELAWAADGFNRGVTANMASNTPGFQGGVSTAMLPLVLTGEITTNLNGFFGQPIDWWQSYASSTTYPSFGQFMPGYDPADTPGVDPERLNWWIVFGPACVRPWRNVAPLFEKA